MSIIPPNISDLFLSFPFTSDDIRTPVSDNMKVMIPITDMAFIMFTFKNANVIPIARASILVAAERISMVFMSVLLFRFSDSFASFIIFIPIKDSIMNANQ